MELRVRRVSQMASGGSYLVIYEADVEVTSADPQVHVAVLSTEPQDADPTLVEMARDGIRRGAERVLGPLGKGAVLRVQHLVVQPSDFKAWRFEHCTAEALHGALE